MPGSTVPSMGAAASLQSVPVCEVLLRSWLRKARLVPRQLTPFPLVEDAELPGVFHNMQDIQAGKKTVSSNGTLFRAVVDLERFHHVPPGVLHAARRYVALGSAPAHLGSVSFGVLQACGGSAPGGPAEASGPVHIEVLLKTSNQRQHHDDIYYEALVHSTLSWLQGRCPGFLPQLWAWFGAVPTQAAPTWKSLPDPDRAREHFQEVASATVTYRADGSAPAKPGAGGSGHRLQWYMCMEPVNPGISLSRYCVEQCTSFADFMQLWYMSLGFLTVTQSIIDPRTKTPWHFTHYDLHSSNILLRYSRPDSPGSLHTCVFVFPPPAVGAEEEPDTPELIPVTHAYQICLIDFARAHIDEAVLRDQESQRLQYQGTPWQQHLRKTWHSPDRQYGVAPYRFHAAHDMVKLYYSCVRFLTKNKLWSPDDFAQLQVMTQKVEYEFPEVRLQPDDKRGHLCTSQTSRTGTFNTPFHFMQWCRQQWNVEPPVPAPEAPHVTYIHLDGPGLMAAAELWTPSPGNPDAAMWDERLAATETKTSKDKPNKAEKPDKANKADKKDKKAKKAPADRPPKDSGKAATGAVAVAAAVAAMTATGSGDPTRRQRNRGASP